MSLKRCSKKNCGNTLTTSRGTYTFYNDRIYKSEAAKLCKNNGGIIAPLNIQEEFDAVHKFTYECQPWCGVYYYHVGLDLVRNETRFYSDCTEWDWEKHDKLYNSYIGKGPCWIAHYRPFNKIQTIFDNKYCSKAPSRTICFNAAGENLNKTEALIQEKSAEGLNHFYYLSAIFALALLAIGLAIALVKLTNKNKKQQMYI